MKKLILIIAILLSGSILAVNLEESLGTFKGMDSEGEACSMTISKYFHGTGDDQFSYIFDIESLTIGDNSFGYIYLNTPINENRVFEAMEDHDHNINEPFEIHLHVKLDKNNVPISYKIIKRGKTFIFFPYKKTLLDCFSLSNN